MNYFRIFDFPITEFPQFNKKNFVLIRECGKGEGGIIKAVALSFIEQLIFAQGTNSNNFYFIEELLETMKTRKDMENFIELFEEIEQQKAKHEKFALEIRNKSGFQLQFANFCKLLLNIQKRVSFENIIELLNTFSNDYNTKITIFDGKFLKIRKNPSLYPLKIFIILIKSNYFIAYKSCYNDYYKNARPSKPISSYNIDGNTETFKNILECLPLEKFEFNEAEKSKINNYLRELSHYTSEPENFELELSARTLDETCSSCSNPGTVRFMCNCVFCKKCLKDFDFLGVCISCETDLNSRDNAVIIKLRSDTHNIS